MERLAQDLMFYLLPRWRKYILLVVAALSAFLEARQLVLYRVSLVFSESTRPLSGGIEEKGKHEHCAEATQRILIWKIYVSGPSYHISESTHELLHRVLLHKLRIFLEAGPL